MLFLKGEIDISISEIGIQAEMVLFVLMYRINVYYQCVVMLGQHFPKRGRM
jgi:hypothetical protein